MSGHWKWIVAVPFAAVAACSSHNANYDSASSAGAVAPDSAMRDTTTAPAMAPTPVDSTMMDTTKRDTTKKSHKKY